MATLSFRAANGIADCAKDEHKIVDRISQLPNEVLVHIFYFLRLEDAARTSILSKRWRNLWTFVVGLDFDASKVLDRIAAIPNPIRHDILRRKERRKYVQWVNEVLELNKVQALDTFRICFDLDKAVRNVIDKWLQYAFARRVQRLELNLLEDGKKACDSSRAYPFPNGLIFEKSSEELHSSYCDNGIHSPKFDFKFLRALTFRSVDVSGDVLQFFLQSCPFLEHLAVDSSRELKSSFEVRGPSLRLKYLEICNCVHLDSITLCDTNIVSLKITHVEKLVLKSVPTLENVWVSGSSNRSLVNAVIPRLFCCFSKLEVLTLQATSYHVRREKLVSVIRPELTNLKQLILVAEASHDDSLIAFTSLIMASPNLEKFVLKLEWCDSIARKGRQSKKALRFPLQHLKVVELYGYYGRTSEVELVEYFLENAIALERIIVDPHDQPISGRRRNQAEEEASARSHAKEQLERLVPSHVEFKLLDL